MIQTIAAALLIAQLSGGVEMKVERPDAVPLSAITNADLVVYCQSARDRSPHRIPDRGERSMLAPKIVRMWSPDYTGQCIVKSVKVKRGLFKFYTLDDPQGPRGWIQDLGYATPKGWAYRYWLADAQE